jgi:soluble lytic murein transglycosylase-like protein
MPYRSVRYDRRGDLIRRRRRVRQLMLAVGGAAAMMTAGRYWGAAPSTARAAEPEPPSLFAARGEWQRLWNQLEDARGEAMVLRAQVARADQVIAFSTRYHVPASLAGTILDVASAEGIDPELAFRLVRLESEFNPRAVSPAGALGLAQLMPGTAARFERGLTRDRLLDPATNVRIGMRYLRVLLARFDGDVRLALLAYNRGEFAVERDLRAGINPSNGYERRVLAGYSGRPLVD